MDLHSYNSAFKKWDEVSSVRSKPRRVLGDPESEEGIYFFSPDIVPMLEHPLIKEQGENLKKKLLIYQLHIHLTFTETLEHAIVNRVAYHIGTKKFDFDLPMEMIKDAWKLYVDEAYHFKFSTDLATQIEAATKIERPKLDPPRFLRKLNAIIHNSPLETRELLLTFFSIVSETLITSSLSEIPKDKRVVKTVREVYRDHAEDEARHHQYFSSLLHFVWNKMKPYQQKMVGSYLPEFLFGFVEPDYESLKTILRYAGFNPKQISDILEMCYPREKVIEDTRNAARLTLQHFLEAGVFEEKYTREKFLESGLIDEKFLLGRRS